MRESNKGMGAFVYQPERRAAAGGMEDKSQPSLGEIPW